MKKALLVLSIFWVVSLIPLLAAAHNTMEVEREIIPVSTCPDAGYPEVECVKYRVKGGSGVTLSYLAKRYSQKEFKPISVDLLLALNPHIAKREIPEVFKGYSAPPWNRTSADWLFDGDEITLPFVFKDEVVTAKVTGYLQKDRQLTVESLLKDNAKLTFHRDLLVALLAGAVFFMLVFLLAWRLECRRRRRAEEDLGDLN